MKVFSSKNKRNSNYNRKSNQSKYSSIKKNELKRSNRISKIQKRKSMQTSKSSQNIQKNYSSSTSGRQYRNRNVNVSLSKSSSKKPKSFLNRISLYVFRMIIFGAGLGAILGTILANIDLTKPLFPNLNLPLIQTSNTEKINAKVQSSSSQFSSSLPLNSSLKNSNSFSLNQKLMKLEEKFVTLQEKYPQLQAKAFFIDLDNNNYADFNGNTKIAAASTIKIPILIAFFQDVDAGKVYLDEKLTMDKEIIAGGSGGMQYEKAGNKYTAIDTASRMIITSDNTATNMIIKRLGGADVLNQRFKSWGLEVTAIRNPLPDLEGTNTTSPKDLVYLLTKINNGELVSLKSRDRILGIMQKTITKSLLPKGLEKEAIISHKTGDIGTVLGDAGIVDMTTGKRYIGAVFVKRPHNDPDARTLVQEISRTSYQHFKWYLPHPPLTKK